MTSGSTRRLVVMLGSAMTGVSLGGLPAKQTPFVASVLGHFEQWDVDHDGQISMPEIDTLLKDAKVAGDDAAAMSALKLVTRSGKNKLPPLTADYFRQYNDIAAAMPAKEAGGDAVDTTTATEGGNRNAGPATKPIDAPDKWDRYFAAGRRRLADARGTQWSTSTFSLGQMKQGALGDCFFVASLGAVVGRRPEEVNKMIAQQPDGSYVATFPGVKPFKVAKLTDSQIAIGGTSGEGAFLAVFEQAYGKYRGYLRGRSLDLDGTDQLYTGGDSAPTLQQLTGNDVYRVTIPRTVEDRADKRDTILPEIRRLLVDNIDHRRAITCGGVVGVFARDADKPNATTAPNNKTLPVVPPAILKNHVYVITDYDPAADRVTIWNPHSNTFKPKGAPGIRNGYVTEKGKFTLPLTEAYQFYGSFTFETDKPVKPPVPKSVSQNGD